MSYVFHLQPHCYWGLATHLSEHVRSRAVERVEGFLVASIDEIERSGSWAPVVLAERATTNPFTGAAIMLHGWAPDPSFHLARPGALDTVRSPLLVGSYAFDILPPNGRPQAFIADDGTETVLHAGMLNELYAILHASTEPDSTPDWIGPSERDDVRYLRELPDTVVEDLADADDEMLVRLARRWARAGWFSRFYAMEGDEAIDSAAYALVRSGNSGRSFPETLAACC